MFQGGEGLKILHIANMALDHVHVPQVLNIHQIRNLRTAFKKEPWKVY